MTLLIVLNIPFEKGQKTEQSIQNFIILVQFSSVLLFNWFQSDDKLGVLALPNIAEIQIFVKYGEELGCQMGHTYAKFVVRP